MLTSALAVKTFSKVKTEKTTQTDIGAQHKGERLEGWISAYIGRVDDFYSVSLRS